MASRRMIYFKRDDEIELIRQSCLLVSKALALVASMLRPGITGLEIDKVAEQLIRDEAAVPGFLGYNGFPNTLCISKNEQIVHGIPDDTAFVDGDIVSVDCGVLMNEFYGDSAFTFAIGEVNEEVMELLHVTRTSLYKGIEQASVGKRIGDIAFAIQNYAEKEHPYGVIRELVGHGIGRNLHEAPEVPNYGRRGSGPVLKDGMVIAIEPMVNLGRKEIRQLNDGWTIISKDKTVSAHYEHTVAIRKEGYDILSDHSLVETAIKNNPEINEISIKN